jgi:uncharacterized membrane protein YfcA
MFVTPGNALLIAAAGLVTGVLGAVLGTGGGVFLIPALVLVLGVPMHYAVATSLVSVIATSSAVASTNVERGTANMRLGMTLEIATAIGAVVGGLTAGWISPRALEGLFAVVLLPTAYLMWRPSALRGKSEPVSDLDLDLDSESAWNSGSQSGLETGAEARPERAGEPQAKTGELGATYYDELEERTVSYRVERLWAGLGISFLAGNLSGLLGIGGGTFKVPALHLVCRVPMKAAAATSNFMIGVTSAASAFLYYGRGDVRPALTSAVALGVVAGSAVGSMLNRRLRGSFVRTLFSVLLAVVAVQMLVRAFIGG